MWKEYFDFSFGYLVVSQQLVIMAVLDPTLFDHVGLWLEPLGNRCMVELCLLSRKTKVWTYFFRWKRRLAEKLSVKLKLAGLIKLMPEKVVHLCSLLAVTTQSAHAWTNSWALTIRNLTWRTRLAPLSEKKQNVGCAHHNWSSTYHNDFGPPGHRISHLQLIRKRKKIVICTQSGANIVLLRLWICEPLVVVVSMWHHLIAGAAEILTVKVNQEAKWIISDPRAVIRITLVIWISLKFHLMSCAAIWYNALGRDTLNPL